MIAGESNLKIRRPLDLGAGMVGSAAAAHALVGVLRCEPPNPNLHYFAGRFTYRAPDGPRHLVAVLISARATASQLDVHGWQASSAEMLLLWPRGMQMQGEKGALACDRN